MGEYGGRQKQCTTMLGELLLLLLLLLHKH
jgi:hypothetical protein